MFGVIIDQWSYFFLSLPTCPIFITLYIKGFVDENFLFLTLFFTHLNAKSKINQAN